MNFYCRRPLFLLRPRSNIQRQLHLMQTYCLTHIDTRNCVITPLFEKSKCIIQMRLEYSGLFFGQCNYSVCFNSLLEQPFFLFFFQKKLDLFRLSKACIFRTVALDSTSDFQSLLSLLIPGLVCSASFFDILP